MTSIGPDWVAKSTRWRLLRKCAVSVTPARGPSIQKTPFGLNL
jgi:hypothetical protein